MAVSDQLDFEAFARNETIHIATTKYIFCTSKKSSKRRNITRKWLHFYEEISNLIQKISEPYIFLIVLLTWQWRID